jgi:hypothetical protein
VLALRNICWFRTIGVHEPKHEHSQPLVDRAKVEKKKKMIPGGEENIENIVPGEQIRQTAKEEREEAKVKNK